MGDYYGVIIEESLQDRGVLDRVRIESSRVEPVTEQHATPWLTQWTLHNVLVPEARAAALAEQISASFESGHAGSWYADFKNETHHYVVFPDKIFVIDRASQAEYDAAKEYGIMIGIPAHQVDFHPSVEDWQR